MKDRPKIVAVDLDGTIFDSKSCHDLGKPIPGIREKLQKFKDRGWVIVIWTVRAKSKEVIDHLNQHEIPFDHFNESPWQPKDSSAKVKADVYLDDRAVSFSGDPKDYDRAMEHSPWWEKALGEEDDFRGGDPEEMRQKKEEKREEAEEMKSIRRGCNEEISGGLSSGKCPSDYDQAELEAGVKVELEHTGRNKKMAREIAMDHLQEDPQYYRKLAKMENVGKAQAGEESGEFRGGDPEEIQQKREEKREEAEESGELEDEADDAEAEDEDELAEQAEEDEEAAAEKSFSQGHTKESVHQALTTTGMPMFRGTKPKGSMGYSTDAGKFGHGVYHTSDRGIADWYSNMTGNVSQHHVKLKNPLVLHANEAREMAHQHGTVNSDGTPAIGWDAVDRSRDLTEKLTQQGHDGVAVIHSPSSVEVNSFHGGHPAVKSFNTGSSEVTPVDDHSDFKPTTINGDPVGSLPPVRGIEPTAETRPGKNQARTWSDVTGVKLPLQGEPWVDMRQYTMRGDEEGALKRQATFYRALNHGLTFDPYFYPVSLVKAYKGEMRPGHKYIYREMGPDGVWKYTYTNAIHNNHGPGHIGNMQGHTVEAPEGHIEQNDPKMENPKGAFNAAVDHTMHHGGVWTTHLTDPETGAQREKIIRVHGHMGGKPKQKPIEIMDAAHVRQDQNIPKNEPIDFEKHKIKGKFAGKEYGGQKLRNFKTLEGQYRRDQVYTEVDAEHKPFVEWRFGGESSESDKGRKKGTGEGRTISVKYLDKDHPLAELHDKKASKAGWQHGVFKDKDAWAAALKKKKATHAAVLGLVPSNKFEFIEDKPYLNLVHQGLKKRPEIIPRYTAGKWDNEQQKWIPGGQESSWRPKKTYRVDWDDHKQRDNFLDKLTHSPRLASSGGGKVEHGELYPLMLYTADRLIRRYNTTSKTASPIQKREKIDLIRNVLLPAGRMGVSRALDHYNPHREDAVPFHSYATDTMKGDMQGALRDYLTESVAGKRERLGTGGVGSGVAGEEYRGDDRSGNLDQALYDHIEQSSATTPEGESPYEDHQRWFDRAIGHMGGRLDHHLGQVDKMDPEEWGSHMAKIDEASEDLEREAEKHSMSNPEVAHEAIHNLISKWNHSDGGGAGFLPDLQEKGKRDLMAELDKVHRGGREADEVLSHEFGKDRLDENLDELHSLMEGHDKQDHPDYDETEHYRIGLNDPDIKRYIKNHKIKTVRDLVNQARTHAITSASGHSSRRAEDNLNRFQDWLKNDPSLDDDYGVPPIRSTEMAPTEPQAPRRPVEEEAAPGVGKRKMAKALEILRKADQGPTPESHPNYFDDQGRKLFQPIPDGVQAEDNPEYDPDPESGNTWAKRYQDPETGSTRYSYLHQDRVGNPKLHHNNAMRYLDTQLPKVRQFYKQQLASQDPTERAIGLFLALMDQAKARHHDEAEGGLTSLRVKDVSPGEGDTTELRLGDGYMIRMTMDQVTRAVLDELLQGKRPEDPVFAVGDQVIDPAVVEQTLSGNFGVSADSFRSYHGTKEYSKEFQRKVDEGEVDSVENAKQQALDATGAKLGHESGGVAVHDHIDPIAMEALHIMGAPKVRKSLLTNPTTGESRCLKSWAKKYAWEIRKAAYKLQGRIEFQGLPISIENKKGSTRKWYDPHAKESGSTKMHFDYGYIRRTKGTDGDHVDVYVGSNHDASHAYVIHQMKKPAFKEYDEDKCMLGFGSAKEAKEAYLRQYDDPRFFGTMTVIPMEKFKEKVMDKKTQGHMVKSVVWHVSVDHPDRSEEEELFGRWLHEYPIHEHEVRWKKRKDRDAEHQAQPKRVVGSGDIGGVLGEPNPPKEAVIQ